MNLIETHNVNLQIIFPECGMIPVRQIDFFQSREYMRHDKLSTFLRLLIKLPALKLHE